MRQIVITVTVEEDEPMDIEDEALADAEETVKDILREYGYSVKGS